jgi:hypothetical protein
MNSSKKHIETSADGSVIFHKNPDTNGIALSGTGLSFADHSQMFSPQSKKDTLKMDAFNQTDDDSINNISGTVWQ